MFKTWRRPSRSTCPPRNSRPCMRTFDSMPRSLGGDKFARDEKERHLTTRTIRTVVLAACVSALYQLSPSSGRAQTRASATSRGWRPARPALGDSLVVHIQRLGDSTAVVFFRAAHPKQSGNGDLFYPSAIHLPRPGAWLIVATAGKQWGCFALSLAESQ